MIIIVIIIIINDFIKGAWLIKHRLMWVGLSVSIKPVVNTHYMAHSIRLFIIITHTLSHEEV